MKNASIWGLGLWVPNEIRKNTDWPPSFAASVQMDKDQLGPVLRPRYANDDIGQMVKRHAEPHASDPFRGFKERRVAGTTLAIDAEIAAARSALHEAGLEATDIDVVLSASTIPDQLLPSNAPLIVHRLGAKRAAGYQLDVACASGIAQIILGNALIRSGQARHVLCVQSLLMTRTLDMKDAYSVMWGDAAAAVVLGPAQGDNHLLGYSSGTDGSVHSTIVWRRDDGEQTPWYQAGSGYRLGSGDGQQLKEFTERVMHCALDTCRAALDHAHVSPRELAALATIQTAPWFQPVLAEGLGLSAEQMPSTFHEYGHIGGAAVVANLMAARDEGRLCDGALAGMFAFGTGLSHAAAIFRWGR